MSKRQQAEKEVSIQGIMAYDIHEQVALIGVENGEGARAVILRGLNAIDVDVPDNQLVDRRGRRRARCSIMRHNRTGGGYGGNQERIH